ncbi:hypothetical protein ACQ4M4_00460 [Leptolyngbya sp. AN02str]
MGRYARAATGRLHISNAIPQSGFPLVNAPENSAPNGHGTIDADG